MIAPRLRSPFPAAVCYILETFSASKTSDAGGHFKTRQGDCSGKAQDKLTAHSVGEEPQSESHFGLGHGIGWLIRILSSATHGQNVCPSSRATRSVSAVCRRSEGDESTRGYDGLSSRQRARSASAP